MLSKEEILKVVNQNIHQIPVSEFVSEGGWPNLENLDILVYHQEQNEDKTIIRLDILYLSTKPGCCFIPSKEQYLHLPKQIILCSNEVKITDY